MAMPPPKSTAGTEPPGPDLQHHPVQCPLSAVPVHSPRIRLLWCFHADTFNGISFPLASTAVVPCQLRLLPAKNACVRHLLPADEKRQEKFSALAQRWA
ncbi:hypothetical protein MHYP_G00127130 [Metynnis hypsauchen]